MMARREGYFRTHPVNLALLELLPCRRELYLGVLVCPPQTPLSGEMTDREANPYFRNLPFLLWIQHFLTGNVFETQFHPLYNGHVKW